MHVQGLIFGLLLGGLGVVGWDASTGKAAGGVPHASGVPDKVTPVEDHCCLIPANRGLHRIEP